MAHFQDLSRGNYRNYYKRRRGNNTSLSSDQDERIAELIAFDWELFKGKVVLDIGCNSGNVSTEIGGLYISITAVSS